MVPVNRLHDPCLVALFKQLPPADQITARTVCRRWADLVTYAARSTRSLAILLSPQGDFSLDGHDHFGLFTTEWFINRDSTGTLKLVKLLKSKDTSAIFPLEQCNKWNSLLYRQLGEDTVDQIATTFVNINKLVIGMMLVSALQLDRIIHLLHLWCDQLFTLKLYEYLGPGDFRHSADRLFNALNGLSSLKNLHLYLECLPYRDLSILSQLDQLFIRWIQCPPSQFADLLRQHVSVNSPLHRIEYFLPEVSGEIDDDDDDDDEIDEFELAKVFTSLDDHLLARFTRIAPLLTAFINLEFISTHFRRLTCLSIKPTGQQHNRNRTTLDRLFVHLSKLTKLVYLCLDINFAYIDHSEPHLLLLPQLQTIKALELTLSIHSHTQLKQLELAWTMPNLEAICFDLYTAASKCTDCGIELYGYRLFGSNPSTTAKHCYRQMLAYLKGTCTQVHTILHHCDEGALGPFEEEELAE